MQQRGITQEMLEAVLVFGREVYGPGTVLYVVGHREVERWRREGARVEDLEGLHVVCSPSGAVLTTYRNHTLKGLRALRHHTPRRGPRLAA
jgi:hypothetical protein